MPEDLPKGWVKTTLGEVCTINPRPPLQHLPPDHTEVSFVPMAAVEEQTGRLDASQTRPLGTVRRGYTPFQENDVIFAKITPCMENGKIALAKGLKNGLAYGSTEFFVFRPHRGLLPKFLLYVLLQASFRKHAKQQMTGAVGQKRVPRDYLLNHEFAFPPTSEQERIVMKLDAGLLGLERGEAVLRRIREGLNDYRASVLSTAVTGELTREWREMQLSTNREYMATGEALLQSILAARRAQLQHSEFRGLREKRKSSKKSMRKPLYSEPEPADTSNLPGLPRSWTWASLDQLLSALRNGVSQAPRATAGLPILRISAVRAMRVDLNDRRYLPLSTSGKYQDFTLREGDLLFTRYNGSRNLAGVCGRVPEVTETIVYPDKLVRGLPAQSDKYLSFFVEIAANSGVSRQHIEAHLFTTAGQWGISGRNLKRTPIPFPSETEQLEIVREVGRRLLAADRLTEITARQMARAWATRELLLRDAFIGRLTHQDPKDEPATVLLERMRVLLAETEARKPKGKQMPKPKSDSRPARRPLLDVLHEYAKPMTPEQLFMNSGYQQEFEESECRHEVAESFYDELRQLIGPKGPVLERRPDHHTVLLEIG